jgi:hypothetical protein
MPSSPPHILPLQPPLPTLHLEGFYSRELQTSILISWQDQRGVTYSTLKLLGSLLLSLLRLLGAYSFARHSSRL